MWLRMEGGPANSRTQASLDLTCQPSTWAALQPSTLHLRPVQETPWTRGGCRWAVRRGHSKAPDSCSDSGA